MTVTAVNHFTILTDDLPATLAFYEEHLNLKPGARPAFTFPGAWLYADGGKGPDPILHIVAGIKKERLIAVGFGETRPVADNGTEEGKAQNRRTEFKIAELNGKKYLGMPPEGPPGGKVYDL